MQSVRFTGLHLRSRTPSTPSLPESRRLSFHRGSRTNPSIPSVYITAPVEEGGETWCALESESPSLSVELPDIDELEAIVEDLRKTYSELPSSQKRENSLAGVASSRTYSFGRREELGTIREPAIHNTPDLPELCDYEHLYPTRNNTLKFGTVPVPQLQEGKYSATRGTDESSRKLDMFKKITSMGKRTWKRSTTLFTQSGSHSQSRPTTPITSPTSYGHTLRKQKLKKPSLSQLVSGPESQHNQSIQSATDDNPLGIFTAPTHEPGQSHLAPNPTSSLPLTPFSSTSSSSFTSPVPKTPKSRELDKPLPNIPFGTTTTSPDKTRGLQIPVHSPPSAATHKFSLKGLRQLFKFGPRSMTTEHTNDSSLSEESGSSGAPSSQDAHETLARIPRSTRLKIDSLHFEEFNMDSLRF